MALAYVFTKTIISKKTRTQIIGYEKDGLSEYEAFKKRLSLISSLRLTSSTNAHIDKLYIPVLFKEFKRQRGPYLAKNTIDNYKSIYNQYILPDFKNKDIRNITSNDLQLYINKQLTRRRPSTVEKIVSALKRFYIYLQSNGIYNYNPSATLFMPKYDNKKYFSISKRNVKRIIKYIVDMDDEIYKSIYFMLLHSRRISEVLSLKWCDIDFTSNIYYLNYQNTKTRKNQYYYLEKFQAMQLKKLRGLNPESIFVFENALTKKPYTYTSVFRVHKRMRNELELSDFTIHSMRHMVAFLMVSNGYSLEITARVLGHSSISSTARYATVEMKKARTAYYKTFSEFIYEDSFRGR